MILSCPSSSRDCVSPLVIGSESDYFGYARKVAAVDHFMRSFERAEACSGSGRIPTEEMLDVVGRAARNPDFDFNFQLAGPTPPLLQILRLSENDPRIIGDSSIHP